MTPSSSSHDEKIDHDHGRYSSVASDPSSTEASSRNNNNNNMTDEHDLSLSSSNYSIVRSKPSLSGSEHKSSPSTPVNFDKSKYILVIVVGILFHLAYMMSIFDIYFKSPIVHGMDQNSFDRYLNDSNINLSTVTSSQGGSSLFAKRLVFIVGDGLRADKLFEIVRDKDKMVGDDRHQFVIQKKKKLGPSPYNIYEGAIDSQITSALSDLETSAPFIRSKMETVASFGISHTRVPTESRPCHVAMIAGFYEDVSAVTTGWKENPIEFDSVFNQTNYVLQIGSPDVVHLFKGSHIDTYNYPPEMEDFAMHDKTTLDRWVFDKFEQLISHNETVQNKLNQDKVIIFLHLLGIDTSGHAYKMGKGYYDSIRYVDEGVERVHNLISNFFGDNETAFIFTADHGMSSKGSHGDGNPECTRTPLVCWGKGIRPFYEGKGHIISDGSFPSIAAEEKYVKQAWMINPKYRKDIKQADMATLMSALLGIPFPMNNVGILPLSYLNGNEMFRSINLHVNAKQISEQFLKKQDVKKEKTLLFFRHYMKRQDLELKSREITSLIMSGDFEKAQEEIYQLINMGIRGLNYFMTYDWPQLMSTVILGYIGWMFYLLVFCLRHYTKLGHEIKSDKNVFTVSCASVALFVVLSALLFVQHDPLHYHMYIIFPIYFFAYIFNHTKLIYAFLTQHFSIHTDGQSLLVIIAVLEVMVCGYYSRDIFSVCFIVLGVLPTILEMNFTYRFGWLTTCIIMSLFTLLPPDYGNDITLVICGAIVFCVCQITWRFIKPPKETQSLFQQTLFYGQLVLILLACGVTVSTDLSLSKKQGLPLLNQLAAWILSIVSLLLPFLSSNFYQVRAQSILSSFATPLVLLSVNYEVLFYAGVLVTFLFWMRQEKQKRKKDPSFNPGWLSKTEFSTAIFFIFLFNVGFFGTGNLATIASFELSSVYRFISIFSPFTMAAILIFKLAIPLLAVTVIFVIILRVSRTPHFAALLVVLALSDIMTINFFFLVSDIGSWLEIGNSISRFAIGNAMIIILLLLFSFAQIYVRNVHNQPGGVSNSDLKSKTD
ncbi:hypothetical protein C9374_012442 [Naegleria lovaniensis]|uniref:GPI ethanolamine phosphate transferase 1 n=1 Tax=Naegleria lovaniensis TaxID=51637 RepID=A0AA88GZR0_NAELO|nr:uncharacterized protein C9374_012442 [Naegleria lovaniensis]KAG2392190.1 hypothetical protein C9374_012442 [Naegleria lovaniensis]